MGGAFRERGDYSNKSLSLIDVTFVDVDSQEKIMSKRMEFVPAKHDMVIIAQYSPARRTYVVTTIKHMFLGGGYSVIVELKWINGN